MSRLLAVALLISVGLIAVLPSPAAATDRAVHRLAGGCFAARDGGVDTGPLSFKATGLGTFLITDRAGRLLGVRDDDRVGPLGGPADAGPAAEWAPARVAARTFVLRSTAARRPIRTGSEGRLRLGTPAARFRLTRARGCSAFPEAAVGAFGRPGPSRNADGTLRGFADTHLHVTGDMRAGGRVMGGEPFDRFGIVRALGRDAADHGADGSRDFTGNLLRDGLPTGTHDPAGWPTFAGWPTHDTNTHQQAYYRWLERTWRAGLRLTVAETVEDTQLCKVEPVRRYPCDETTAIAGQVGRLRALEDHVDAQSGGPGRGWFRIVSSPAAARRVIARGKLAVVLGVESSFPLDCRAEAGRRCTPAQVDRRLDRLHRLGIRSLFIAHWADNGFAGAAVEDGLKGKFINALNWLETGRWFSVGAARTRSRARWLRR